MKNYSPRIILGLVAVLLSSKFFAGNDPNTGFLRFEAIQHEGKIDIIWKVAPTADVKKFVVQRSKDGVNFESLTELNRGVFTPEFAPEFGEFVERDYTPYAGTSFYRLLEEKTDGKTYYSEVVPVNLQYSNGKWHIMTEAEAANVKEVDLSYLKNKTMLLVLRDKKGIEFFANVVVTETGKTIKAKVDKGIIPAGQYLVIATSKDELFSKNVTIVE